MTTNNALTDEILNEAIEDMTAPTFDSHCVIRQLMKRHPREYATDLHVTAGQDPILTLHATIGSRLSSFEMIEKTRKVKSMNVRGEETENQEWRRK
jgi:hypothetical protein